MKYTVVYSVVFVTEIEVEKEEQLGDIISDIKIPEDDKSQYETDTFEVVSVTLK